MNEKQSACVVGGEMPNVHYFDFLWICCTTNYTTNALQIEVM